MLSYQPMVARQLVQCERGLLMLRCSGRREMQTFRKLPKSRPRRNAGSSKASGPVNMRLQYRGWGWAESWFGVA